MRKVLFVLLMGAMSTSCSKTRCWECTVDIGGNEFREEICGKDKKEIEELQAHPQETKDNEGVVIYITTYSNCSPR